MITRTLARVAAGALLAGGLTVTGAALVPGTAAAGCNMIGQCSRVWCPGQPLPVGGWGVEPTVKWDMNVCHTYYFGNAGHAGSTDGQVEVGWRVMEGEPSRIGLFG
ncbi:hypothetical protein JRC04_25090 [Mycolicibacterium sp. S2-37]|uniref:hypothetical protein n=1 Tax=Mycolicibacterium sp. S2-37 TaxID=2810297 RepID=UPI001A9457A1|nr:hypothetical protein [Mycolicibacterium sp. S2-37]MBO0680754.1 hypothetical protein [Mycolicibacterium sp. S2-37]